MLLPSGVYGQDFALPYLEQRLNFAKKQLLVSPAEFVLLIMSAYSCR